MENMKRIMDTDEEYLDRVDGTPEGNFAMTDGYNRMANEAVNDYNSRPAPDDWNGELRHQEEQDRLQAEQRRNAAMAAQINANRGVYDGYAQMGNAVSARQAQYVNNANAHLASAIRLAAENNGRLPQYAWQGLGAALGLDGKNGAVMGGGYDKKGGFTVMVARQNPQTGQIVQVPMSFTPQQQYLLMLSAPGIFSRQELDGMRGQLINNYGMHPDQVPEVPQGWGETGNVGIGNRAAEGGTSVNPNWLIGPQRRSSISAFGADGRGGFTQYESNEGTGYQLQSRDFGTRERTWDGMSERERIARINADSREKQAQTNADAKVAAAEARGTGRAAGERVPRGTSAAGGQTKFNKDELAAINDEIDALQYSEDEKGNKVKRELSEDEEKRLAQLKARKDEMLKIGAGGSEGGGGNGNEATPPPQQRLVYWRDAQGNLKSGNGYVVDGKVYDANGNQIEGARQTDAKGRVPPTPEQARKLLAEKKKAKNAEAAKAQTEQSSRYDGYDTPLTEEEERQFQEWRATLPKPLQYDGDYDLRGYWKDPDTQKMGIRDGAHFTDKYKKPNHPTFSNESQYAKGVDALKAGHWEGDKFVAPDYSGAEARKPSPDARERENERRAKNAERSEEERFKAWWVEHGGRGMTKEEGLRQFREEEREREERNKVLGTGPRDNGKRGLVASSI